MQSVSPSQVLREGAEVLGVLLEPHGFRFQFRDEGGSSGGRFAWGEFANADRRLELHYRGSLGLVTYHKAVVGVRHEPYMRELGVWEGCRYPGFASEPLQVFHDLAHDLSMAADFVQGSCEVLVAAARKQKIRDDAQQERLMARYQGQTRLLEEMRALFKQAKYREVVALFSQLPASHLLSDAELQLVRIAQRRGGDA